MSDREDYKISVIVPVYNIEQYLPRCLDSILSQTYRNLEIIVVDDGSTDNSAYVIRKYAKKDERIIPIFKKNTGVSDTRNKALDRATGDYIGFADGDDYIEPDMYEHLLNNALKYEADISHCGYQMVFPSRVDYYFNTGTLREQDSREGLKDLMSGNNLVEPGIWNKLYTKAVIGNIRMPKDIKINEDYLFNVEVFRKAKKSIFEDKPLYHYILRKNSAATSNITEKKLFDGITVRERIAGLFENSDDEFYKIALSGLLTNNINLYRMFVTNKATKPFVHKKGKVKADIKKQYTKAKQLGILTSRMKMDCFLIFYLPFAYKLLYKCYFAFSKSDRKYEVK